MSETVEPTDAPAEAPATETPPPSPPTVEERPKSFADMNLDPAVKQALDEMGYEVPMEVQEVIYARVLGGKDLMVQSRTGSGKTAAFGIPIAQILSPQSTGVQALILAPTRELALQVSQELGKICAYRNLQVVPIYGGAPMGRQIEALRAGAQIVAGTPGRILDHMRRGTLKTGGVRMFILDECDEMLSMGFQEDIEKIIAELPPKTERQTLLFSATIPEEIERIGRRHMREPDKVVLSADFIGVHEIEHRYYLVSGLGRTRDLQRILEFERPDSAIVFCNTRDDTGLVAAFLTRNGYDAEAISSDLSQADRERVMGRMRARDLKFLVATDIAARGIDISGLPCVINYTFPEAPEIYIHRTGRTGRAGKSGVAISLVGPREIGSFYYLKLLYKIRPEERELPTEAELRTRREGERYTRLAGEIPGEPGDEWRSLARRIWQSGEGERLIAGLLRERLEGPVPPPVERPPARERETQELRPHDIPRSEDTAALRREPAARREEGRRGREEGRREGGRREAGAGRREEGRRGREEGRREGGRREAGAERRRPREEGRRRSEEPRTAAPPAEGAEGQAPPAAEPGATPREFWETWVDERSAKPAGAAASPPAPAGEGAERPARPPRTPVVDEPGFVRLYINVGKREGMAADDVTKLATEAAPESQASLGRCVVLGTHSYLSVKEEAVDQVIAAINGKKVGDREVVAERAKR